MASAEIADWLAANAATLGLLALVLVTIVVIVLRASRRAKGRTVLLLGAPDSGKTTLFFQLLDGSTHNGTVASMQPNERTADEKSDLAGATLVDVPGHPRVRGEWESHLPTSRGIVFLVDGVNFLPIKTAVAEQLFDVLAHPQVASRRIPVLLAVNKVDAGELAHGVKFILKYLERELEALRSSRADLAAASGGSGAASLDVPAGQTFTFAGLAASKGVIVRPIGISALEGTGLDEVRSFVRAAAGAPAS